MSEDSHEILHMDTLRRIVAATVAAEQKRWADAVTGMATAAAENNDLRVYELMRGLNDALHRP
jgi:hypothetical protein